MYISKNFGFSFSTAKSDIPLCDFLNSLVGKNIEFSLKSGNVRRIIVDQSDNFFCGVVITLKDQRSYASLVNDQGQVKVKISDLADLEQIAEFNFWVINKLNGFGMYQYHYGACTLSNFASMVTSQYRRDLEAKRKVELAKLPDKAPAKQEKAVNSRFFHGLAFEMLVQARDIEEVLAKYKEIRSFKYEVASVEALANDDFPLLGMVSKVRHHVSFDSTVDSHLIIKGIQNMMSSVKDRSGRVEVLDDEDEPFSVKLMDVPVNFGEMPYDIFMKGLATFDSADASKCDLIKVLMDKCEKEYAHVFTKKVAN
ncbi:hypothetical protein [Pseudomonas sp. J380]|uniref:hypothetical protein n=1 Tax=Pseudomonas sp. J380 TaxID=2605424 RepID=UPI0013181DC0|nr:hypothetical protein [Pseudomonas sp. J380]QHA95146.1 hypothetical protein FXO12_00150 [Pseudomonas sp. J380]